MVVCGTLCNDNAVAVIPARKLVPFWPQSVKSRGMGTESLTGTGTLPNGDFDGRNRPSSGARLVAGFWVSPIGRIEASPEGPLPFEPSPVNATPSGLIAKSWSRVVGQNYQTGTSTCETLF